MKQSLSEKNGQNINPSQSMGNSEHRPILIVIAGLNINLFAKRRTNSMITLYHGSKCILISAK